MDRVLGGLGRIVANYEALHPTNELVWIEERVINGLASWPRIVDYRY
jgi:hypothetical protein